MIIVLGHIVARHSVALNKQGAVLRHSHIPAYIAHLGDPLGGFKHHFYRLGVKRNLETHQLGFGKGMNFVKLAGLIAESGLKDHAVFIHRGVHAAAGDIVYRLGAVAHTHQGIH